MTNGEIILKMFQAFAKGDDKSFREAANDCIGEEKRKNHHVLARELERILMRANGSAGFASKLIEPWRLTNQSPQDKNRSADLVEVREADQDLEELILLPGIYAELERICNENKRGEILRSHGIRPANKLLFYGPPGCGKTVTAEAIAKKLYLPLVLVRFDAVVSSYLGDTAANLRQVFEFARHQPMVLFFDEFDAIGKRRDDGSEHGELKRVVNSFLQMLDSFVGESLIIAATNHEGMLDPALWRRFDDIVAFARPDSVAIEKILHRNLRQRKLAPDINLQSAAKLLSKCQNSAHADAERVARDAIKATILQNDTVVSKANFEAALTRTLTRLSAVQNLV